MRSGDIDAVFDQATETAKYYDGATCEGEQKNKAAVHMDEATLPSDLRMELKSLHPHLHRISGVGYNMAIRPIELLHALEDTFDCDQRNFEDVLDIFFQEMDVHYRLGKEDQGQGVSVEQFVIPRERRDQITILRDKFLNRQQDLAPKLWPRPIMVVDTDDYLF